jgi:uncharacterized membrane protein (UPF0127 family)
VADRPFGRMKGLLGRSALPPGEGLFLRPASSVHTFFMRFPIDVVFVDRELRVLSIVPELRPWRAAGRRGAHSALELPAGECDRRGLRPGDLLRLEEDRQRRSEAVKEAAAAHGADLAAAEESRQRVAL